MTGITCYFNWPIQLQAVWLSQYHTAALPRDAPINYGMAVPSLQHINILCTAHSISPLIEFSNLHYYYYLYHHTCAWEGERERRRGSSV